MGVPLLESGIDGCRLHDGFDRGISGFASSAWMIPASPEIRPFTPRNHQMLDRKLDILSAPAPVFRGPGRCRDGRISVVAMVPFP